MKSFTNANPRDLAQGAKLLQQAQASGRHAAVAGGGSDLLGMIKDNLVAPDVLVHLKGVKGLDQVASDSGGARIGGQITLDALSSHSMIRSR